MIASKNIIKSKKEINIPAPNSIANAITISVRIVTINKLAIMVPIFSPTELSAAIIQNTTTIFIIIAIIIIVGISGATALIPSSNIPTSNHYIILPH